MSVLCGERMVFGVKESVAYKIWRRSEMFLKTNA